MDAEPEGYSGKELEVAQIRAPEGLELGFKVTGDGHLQRSRSRWRATTGALSEKLEGRCFGSFLALCLCLRSWGEGRQHLMHQSKDLDKRAFAWQECDWA